MSRPRATQAEALDWFLDYVHSGSTIEDLTLDYHRKKDTIRDWLGRMGCPIRPPGVRPGEWHRWKSPSSRQPEPSLGPGIHFTRLHSANGHRRRGRL